VYVQGIAKVTFCTISWQKKEHAQVFQCFKWCTKQQWLQCMLELSEKIEITQAVIVKEIWSARWIKCDDTLWDLSLVSLNMSYEVKGCHWNDLVLKCSFSLSCRKCSVPENTLCLLHLWSHKLQIETGLCVRINLYIYIQRNESVYIA
jgi:hypothetical protein